MNIDKTQYVHVFKHRLDTPFMTDSYVKKVKRFAVMILYVKVINYRINSKIVLIITESVYLMKEFTFSNEFICFRLIGLCSRKTLSDKISGANK